MSPEPLDGDRQWGSPRIARLKRAALRLLPATLLVSLASMLVWTSIGKILTYDEPRHLRHGYRFLTEGPTADADARTPISVLSALPCVPWGCQKETLRASGGLRMLVRAPTMAFALGLGALLYLWVSESLGAGIARLTLLLYVLNPTVLAHGKQVTTDMPTAFFTTASLYAVWHFARGRGATAFLAAVVAAAGAILSKLTSLYLLALLPPLAAWSAWYAAGTPRLTLRLVGRAVAVVGAFLLGVLLLVNAAYLFAGTGTPSREVAFQSQGLRRLAEWDLPLPIPVPMALGIDAAATWSEWRATKNYLLGDWNREGVWYAFPVMLLLKTPLAFLILLAISLRAVRPRGDPLWFLWLVPALAHLALFSLAVRPQIGIRYLLPAVVLLVPLAAAAALPAARLRPLPLVALVSWHAVSTLSYLPHPMSYFNELIGRRIRAYRFLADSNLDWEDRTVAIRRYIARHPEQDIAVEPTELRPGYVIVGANNLLGITAGESYRYLRRLEPVDHVGYSHLVFRLTDVDMRRIRRRELDGR